MGGSQSSAEVDARQTLINEIVQKCGATSCKNKVGALEIESGADVNVSNLAIKQECTVEAECLFNAIANSVADAENKAGADAAAGLGIADSDVKLVTDQDILDIQKQECGIQETENIFEGMKIKTDNAATLDNIEISQISGIKQKCAFEGLVDKAIEARGEAEASASGATIGFGGPVMLILAAVGAFVAYYVFKNYSPVALAAKGVRLAVRNPLLIIGLLALIVSLVLAAIEMFKEESARSFALSLGVAGGGVLSLGYGAYRFAGTMGPAGPVGPVGPAGPAGPLAALAAQVPRATPGASV
jgi:hypothetical protein